jgi:choline kinase
MKEELSLLILAAGMGSRYGGLKQLDGLGPHGETILEYSMYDAIEAGFDKAVFIVRDFFKDEFIQRMEEKFADRIDLRFVCQEVNPKIEGLTLPKREKPWGTSHAVLVAKDEIEGPFAVINADDYYGKAAFQIIADFLRDGVSTEQYAMIGFILDKTLSERGHVNRGVCEMDEGGYLTGIEEVLKIRTEGGKIISDSRTEALRGDEVVSMNFWGFHPNLFNYLEESFPAFVKANLDNPKAEYFIPVIIDELIKSKLIRLKVFTSPHRWYGVTYKEDAMMVKKAFKSFQEEGVYPSPLFS